jgi:dolichol-phosphate mannosyltransferase
VVATPIEVSVVIPAYCEAANLSILVPRLVAALSRAGLRSEVIIVDDDSCDGTDAVCANLAQNYPLRLVARVNERGLASAVIRGFDQALGEMIVVMDADLSHPPETVPALVAACRSPFVDFVIGSRYVEGGSVDPSWSRLRRLNSQVATFLARGLTAARDPLAGFFAIKRTTIRTADELNVLGYKIGLELIVQCNCRRIVEVPIMFDDRIHGKSKLSIVQQWQYLRHLKRLYVVSYCDASRLAQICRVSIGNTIVDLLSFSYLLPWTQLWIARVAAISCAMASSSWWSHRIALRSKTANGVVGPSMSCGTPNLLSATINLAVSLGLGAACSIFRTNPTIAAAIGSVAGAMASFLLYWRQVFNEKVTQTGMAHAQSPVSSQAA